MAGHCIVERGRHLRTVVSREPMMKHTCGVIPIREGRIARARACCDALEMEHRVEYEACKAEPGIGRELFFLRRGPDRALRVLYMGAEDVAKSLRGWVAWDGEFQLWGQTRWAIFTGRQIGLILCGRVPGPVLEVLSAYDYRG